MLKLQQHYHYIVEQIKDLESQLKRKLDEDEVGQRLLSIPRVGTLTASTISTEIGDGRSSTPAAVTLRRATGLVPRQYSTGGRTTLLGISKRGTTTKRSELCWFSVPGYSYKKLETPVWHSWPTGSGSCCVGKSNFVVTCALANKLARIAWALTARQQTYEA